MREISDADRPQFAIHIAMWLDECMLLPNEIKTAAAQFLILSRSGKAPVMVVTGAAATGKSSLAVCLQILEPTCRVMDEEEILSLGGGLNDVPVVVVRREVPELADGCTDREVIRVEMKEVDFSDIGTRRLCNMTKVWMLYDLTKAGYERGGLNVA